MYKKHTVFIFIAVFLLTISLSIQVFAQNNSTILAKVGNLTITQSDLSLEMIKPSLSVVTVGLSSREAKRRVLDTIVENRLIMNETAQKRIIPKANQIELQLSKEKELYGGEGKFQRLLKELNISEKEYRQKLSEQWQVLQLLHIYVYSKVTAISLEEAKSYYNNHLKDYSTGDSVRFRYIYIQYDPNTTSEIKSAKYKKAKDAYDLLKTNDFESIAKMFSESEYGIEIGPPVLKGQLKSLPEIEDTAFTLNEGSYSNIITTNQGLFILKLESKHLGQIKSFDQVKVDVLDKLASEKGKLFYNNWINDLKQKYQVIYYDENL